MIDLAVVSVLLDAGAGADWHYDEAASGQRFARSEGLGVASLHAFTTGLFSSDATDPLRADAAALCALDADRLAAAFQVGPVESPGGPRRPRGRAAPPRRRARRPTGGVRSTGPPGGLFDFLVTSHGRTSVAAHDILSQLLTSLSGIWPADNTIGDQPLGDCWRHAAVPGPGLTQGWMPFHKLSQWLTYSLLEPFDGQAFGSTASTR